jgi:hypothetical protein
LLYDCFIFNALIVLMGDKIENIDKEIKKDVKIIKKIIVFKSSLKLIRWINKDIKG